MYHNTYVALKIQKSASHYIEAAYDEVEILDQAGTYWRKKAWKESIEKYYKDDPHLRFKSEVSGDDCYCV